MNAATITHRSLASIDLIIIGIYFLIIFSIGLYFALKERTTTDYFLASRNIGWFAIGASLFVSNISTEHFIGLAGSGASSGMAVGHFEWLACLILLLLGWVFVPFYLRSNVFTMPEFLERRFNRQCAVYLASISIIAYILTKISVHLWAAAIVLERVVGWSPDEGRDHSGYRDRHLHHCGRTWRGHLHRGCADPGAADGRDRAHVHWHGESGRICGAARRGS